ncbi:MAG: hypothetical protein ACFCUT_22215 [Kiloniellaceae bacterium]
MNKPPAFVPRAVEDLNSERIKEALAIWHGKCSVPGQLPHAEEFDILDYRPAMGNINLLDVHHDPLDFIFRVHSAKGAEYIRRDMTARSVDDYPEPEYGEFIRSVLTEAVTTRRPQVMIEEMFRTENRLMRWEAVAMPLQDGAGQISRLIVAFEILH